ncbi:MAG: hypothetical protein QM757_09455 [Paludibaculum sp.]
MKPVITSSAPTPYQRACGTAANQRATMGVHEALGVPVVPECVWEDHEIVRVPRSSPRVAEPYAIADDRACQPCDDGTCGARFGHAGRQRIGRGGTHRIAILRDDRMCDRLAELAERRASPSSLPMIATFAPLSSARYAISAVLFIGLTGTITAFTHIAG